MCIRDRFTAGDWFYQAVANKSGAEKQTIYTGQFKVLESLEYSGTAVNYDGRSQVEKDLATIQAAIRNIISGGAIQEYKIGTRTAKKYELSELIQLESRYKAELVREKQAEMIANGLGNPRATFVRFNEALDEMVYAYASFQRLLQKYDRRTIYDQFAKRFDSKKPLKEDKIRLNQTKSAKKSNFVSNW